MKASARNQLFGKITGVRVGVTYAEVDISLKGGDTLCASITKESVDALGLAVGLDAVALIKAPQIVIVKDFGGYKLSARNQLSGTVARIQKGAVNAEVVIELPGGETLAATVTNDSVDSLGLAVGESATAVFKAGAVIVGVAGG